MDKLIAVLFGCIAVVTSIILVVDVPMWLDYIFALFWFVTGLLGFYSATR